MSLLISLMSFSSLFVLLHSAYSLGMHVTAGHLSLFFYGQSSLEVDLSEAFSDPAVSLKPQSLSQDFFYT